MSKRRLVLVGAVAIALLLTGVLGVPHLLDSRKVDQRTEPVGGYLQLPAVRVDGPVSLESSLHERRSVREYADEPLSLQEVSQLLWAAQGITHENDLRTAPSAGALYPLEIYLLAGAVDGLRTGEYKYEPTGHQLLDVSSQDKRGDLYLAALKQDSIRRAPIVLAFVAVYERTQVKYGDRSARYVHIEVGGAVQSVYLQATALDLGTVFIGAFSDEQVAETLSLARDERALGLMPVGRAR